MPIGIGNFKPETKEDSQGNPYWMSQGKVGGDVSYHPGVAPFDTTYSPKTAQAVADNDIFSAGDVYMQKGGTIRTASDMDQLRELINLGFSQQSTPGTMTSDDARGELTSLGYDIQGMLDNDRELSVAGAQELQSEIDYYNNEFAEQQRQAEEQFKQMEGTSRVASYRLGQAGTAYEAAQRRQEATAKMRYFKALEAQKQQKIGELKAAYRKADAERTKELQQEIYKIQKDERDFLQTERQNKIKNTLDLMGADREERKMTMEQQKMQMEEQKFGFEIEKTLADLTGTFRGSPTFEAEQTALKNAIDIAGLTGEFMGAQTLEAKQNAIENAFKELGYNLDVQKFEELVKNNEIQNTLAQAKFDLDVKKYIEENGINNALGEYPELQSYARAFNTVSLGLTEGQRKAANAEFKSLLNNGDLAGMREFIVSVAINAAPTEQQNKAFGRAEALDSLDNIQSMLAEFKRKGGNTGIFKGTLEDIANKIGKTTDPELAQIANTIRTSIVNYRRAVSGAAFTESEAAEYERLFPSIGKVDDFNQANIEALRRTFELNQKSFLTQMMGRGNYKDLFESKQVETAQPTSYKTIEEYLSNSPNDLINIESIIRDNPDLSDDEVLQVLESRKGSLQGNQYDEVEIIEPDFNNDLGRSIKGLGKVSEKYESGGDPGAIGYDSTGGYSYGAYQLAHNNAKTFVEQSNFKNEFKGLKFNSKEWQTKWKEVAKKNPDQFKEAQKAYIAKTHYQPQIEKIKKAGININKYGQALKEAIWSTSVQHGGNTDVIVKAYNDAKKKTGREPTEKEFITQIYNERWSGGKRFASSTDNVKSSVKNRFINERKQLLNMIA